MKKYLTPLIGLVGLIIMVILKHDAILDIERKDNNLPVAFAIYCVTIIVYFIKTWKSKDSHE